jgi:hypothetical protein
MRKSWDVTIDIARPPDAVWEVVGDLHGVPKWYPAYLSSTVEDGIRTLQRADGITIREQLEERDDERRFYSYGVVSGLPLAHHLASFEVMESPTGSTVVWHTEAQHEDPEIDMEARLADRQAEALLGLKELLERS